MALRKRFCALRLRRYWVPYLAIPLLTVFSELYSKRALLVDYFFQVQQVRCRRGDAHSCPWCSRSLFVRAIVGLKCFVAFGFVAGSSGLDLYQ